MLVYQQELFELRQILDIPKEDIEARQFTFFSIV